MRNRSLACADPGYGFTRQAFALEHGGSNPEQYFQKMHSSASMAVLVPTYESLFAERYHGAANHKAVLYHAAYASVVSFEMYREDGPEQILSEGFEDVDIAGHRFGHTYVQLKNQLHPMTLPQIGKVLKSFADVLLVDPEARFKLVCASGFIKELARYTALDPATATPPAKLLHKAKEVCRGKVNPKDLLARTTLEHKTQTALDSELVQAVIIHFGIENGSPDPYSKELLILMADRASTRTPVILQDIQTVHQTVWEVLSQGPASIAVQSRLIEEIRFEPDQGVEDYFEGRSARPAHIAVDLDAARPADQLLIRDALRVAQVCAVVASSGQGKSSLAYRYIHDLHGGSNAFLVRGCENEEQAGSIAEFLENRLRLAINLTVMIDNLGFRTRLWHALAERFAGRNVLFLITAREEDWGRFGQTTSAFVWRLVRPTLSLGSAQSIFKNLQAKDRVHPSVRSAEWAFERVHHSGLLIEFVYLVTHGRLLEERLREQIRALQNEDSGKVQALRLVSTADRYGTCLRVIDIRRQAGFTTDPTLALSSLVGEYLAVDGEEIHGLHPVRSRHLSELLDPFGPGHTVAQICGFLSAKELPGFISSALSEPDIEPTLALDQLIRRYVVQRSEPISPVWQACYQAAERLYVTANAEVLADATTMLGNAGVLMLCYLGAPYHPMELENISELFGENGVRDMTALVTRLEPRSAEGRLDYRFIQGVIESPQADLALSDPRRAIDTALAALSSGLDRQAIAVLLEHIDWQATALSLAFPDFLNLLVAAQRAKPEAYLQWCVDERDLLEARFKLETRTFAIEDRNDALVARFHVDLSHGAPDPHDQAMTRLRALAIVLPTYEHYQTEPVYPLGDAAGLAFDGAFRRIERPVLPQEVDVRVNRAWFEAIKRTLAADGWYDWAEELVLAEKAGRSGLRLILAELRALIDHRSISASERVEGTKGLAAWEMIWRTLPDPPITTDERREAFFAKAASDWSSGMDKCIRQGVEVMAGGGDPHLKRLLRFNALSASKSVGPFHETVNEARRLAGLQPIAFHTSAEESLFLDLSLTAEYLESERSPAQDAQRAVLAWDQSRRERLLADLALWCASLPESELGRVVLPKVVLGACPDAPDDDDMPFPTIVLGLRFNSFQDLNNELHGAIAQAALTLPAFAGYLYVFGLHPRGRMLNGLKAHSMKLAGALAGNDDSNGHIILPVEVPMVSAAPFDTIPVWLPSEDDLISKIIDPLRRMAMAEAAYREGLVTLRSDISDERKLLDLLATERQIWLSKDSPLMRRLQDLYEHVPPASALNQWQALVEYLRTAVELISTQPAHYFEVLQPLFVAVLEFLDAAYSAR